jgi:hypothetical protein
MSTRGPGAASLGRSLVAFGVAAFLAAACRAARSRLPPGAWIQAVSPGPAGPHHCGRARLVPEELGPLRNALDPRLRCCAWLPGRAHPRLRSSRLSCHCWPLADCRSLGGRGWGGLRSYLLGAMAPGTSSEPQEPLSDRWSRSLLLRSLRALVLSSSRFSAALPYRPGSPVPVLVPGHVALVGAPGWLAVAENTACVPSARVMVTCAPGA